jgi:hypothetical protein
MALIIHDGEISPIAPTKDPQSDVWYGFEYSLESGEVITGSDWLIDDVLVTAGQSVNGLNFVDKDNSGSVTKCRLSGGSAGSIYRVTNRLSTSATPSDDRTMLVPCAHL